MKAVMRLDWLVQVFPTLGGTNSSTKIVNSETMGTIQKSSQGKRLNKQ